MNKSIAIYISACQRSPGFRECMDQIEDPSRLSETEVEVVCTKR